MLQHNQDLFENPPNIDSSDVSLRSVENDDDTSLWLRIHNSVVPSRNWSTEDLCTLTRTVDRYIQLLGCSCGEVIGAGLAVLKSKDHEPNVALAWISVLAQKRKRGVGSAIYQAIFAWAATHGETFLELWVEESDTMSLAFATHRGFIVVRRETRLSLDLSATDVLPIELPVGVEIVTLATHPSLARGMYEVWLEGFPRDEMPVETFEKWVYHHLKGVTDKPEACFIARVRDEVIGYAKFHLSDDRPGIASHNGTCVRPSWRGHGIARALKCAQVTWAKQSGYDRLEASNDPQNLPKLRLYTGLGYCEIPGRLVLRGSIAHDLHSD